VAEEVLRAQDIRIIAALVESDNPASLALFRKVGYIDAGQGVHYLSKRESADV
jgi:ribosomal protein S18 acetylase RimI-like enzyme